MLTTIEFTLRDAQSYPTETYAGLKERGINDVELTLKECIVIEAVTSQGRTGITFLLQDADGKYYTAQTTSDMIEYGLMAVLRGANARWGVPPRP